MATSPTNRDAEPVVLGVRFAGAADHVRSVLTLGPDDVADVEARLGRVAPGVEVVVVATCNRTELVLAGTDVAGAIEIWHTALPARLTEGREAEEACLAPGAMATVHTGADALEHLCRVACGLDAAIVGDAEILGQLRRAHQRAERDGRLGPVLRRAFREAFAVAKRARTTTAIAAGASGVGSATAALVERRGARRVVVVGAGSAAASVARQLARRSGDVITIVNRSTAAAEALAAKVGGRAAGLEALAFELSRADAVIGASGAREPFLDEDLLVEVRAIAPGWSPLIVDLGVPANVADGLGLDVVRLVELAAQRDEMRGRRREAVAEVEALIAAVVGRSGRGRADAGTGR